MARNTTDEGTTPTTDEGTTPTTDEGTTPTTDEAVAGLLAAIPVAVSRPDGHAEAQELRRTLIDAGNRIMQLAMSI